MCEIGASLFTTLENHFSMAQDGYKSFTGNNYTIKEHHKVLFERLNSTIESLVFSETPHFQNKQAINPTCSSEYKVAASSQVSRYHSLVIILLSAILLGYLLCFFKYLRHESLI